MLSFPFDSHVTYDTDGFPQFDRAVSSEPYRLLLRELFKSGIMPSIANNLQVAANTGMTVKVLPGFAMVDGTMNLETEQRTLTVQASSALDRIDTVVLRLDNNDSARTCDLYVKQGDASSNPKAPTLTREGSIFELGLADLFISSNSSVIPTERITDTRYNSSRCGVISSISELDTTGLYEKVQADLTEFRASNEHDFDVWFNQMKDQLTTDQAGHLQTEINSAFQYIQANSTSINSILDFALFDVPASAWIASGDANYPYIARIITDKFSDTSRPIWQMNGIGDLPTTTERDNISMIVEAKFNTSGATLYATGKPAVNLRLETKGGTDTKVLVAESLEV